MCQLVSAELEEAVTDGLLTVMVGTEQQQCRFIDVHYLLLKKKLKGGPAMVTKCLQAFVAALDLENEDGHQDRGDDPVAPFSTSVQDAVQHVLEVLKNLEVSKDVLHTSHCGSSWPNMCGG
jgi:hypothetical protein